MNRYHGPFAPSDDWDIDSEEEPNVSNSERSSSEDISKNKESSEKNAEMRRPSKQEMWQYRLKEKWLGGSWKLQPFDSKVLPSARKKEWISFRDQFELICRCKVPVDSETKLVGMKIHAGEFLKNVIEKQEKLVAGGDIYIETLKLVDSYFDSTYNKTQQQSEFRQLKQEENEHFADWVLKLEEKAKLCDFDVEREKHEFVQALITNSVLGEKLFEAASFLQNDYQKMVQHGMYLDGRRMKTLQEKKAASANSDESGEPIRPVMWIDGARDRSSRDNREHRSKPYTSYREQREGRDRERIYPPRNWMPANKECEKCGRRHAANRCPAFRSKCNRCNLVGHWASKCKGKQSGRRWEGDHKDEMLEHAARVNKVEK